MGRPRRGWGALRKLPSGRFQASYIGDDLRRHAAPRTFATKMDAEAWLASERRRLDLGEWQAPVRRVDGVLFRDFADEWVEHRKIGRRTRSGYQSLLRLHINPVLGDKMLPVITPQMVRQWHKGLGTEYPTRNAHAYQLLHAIMATAVDDKLIRENPVKIRGAMHAEREREPIILRADKTRDEVAELADAMPRRLGLSVLLAAWCGLRWGETSELRRSDVDVDAGLLRVARGVTYRDGEFTVQSTKGKRVRYVTIPRHVLPAVVEHLKDRVESGSEALLFAAADGGHLLDTAYRKEFAKAAASIGKPDLVVHDLRHFGGTMAARVGGTPADVRARLGHRTVDAAMRYQSSGRERDGQLADALSSLVGYDEGDLDRNGEVERAAE